MACGGRSGSTVQVVFRAASGSPSTNRSGRNVSSNQTRTAVGMRSSRSTISQSSRSSKKNQPTKNQKTSKSRRSSRKNPSRRRPSFKNSTASSLGQKSTRSMSVPRRKSAKQSETPSKYHRSMRRNPSRSVSLRRPSFSLSTASRSSRYSKSNRSPRRRNSSATRSKKTNKSRRSSKNPVKSIHDRPFSFLRSTSFRARSSAGRSNRSLTAARQRNSSSVDRTQNSLLNRSSSIPLRSQSANSDGSARGPAAVDQSRGRTSLRNKDIYQRRRRSSSVDATTPISITQTPNLAFRDEEYEKLRRTPSDNRREWNKRFPEGHLVIYTDGSAKGNSSGMGIYMGAGHELNRSQRIDTPPHSSDRAEILAAIQALRNLREWPQYRNEKVILRTDSWGVVKAANGESGGPRWYMKMLQDYPSEIKEMREEAGLFPEGVLFEHVYAHDGDPGNEAADDLSRQVTVGPQRSRSMSRDRSGEPARRRSLSNDPNHIRSHSAFVPHNREL